ncbi:hypothetical protein HDV00_004417 [Rhizophlyctis rosea]|nr:hypothetical protein HDV00_004417 [Rhizophlyctis rosea]
MVVYEAQQDSNEYKPRTTTLLRIQDNKILATCPALWDGIVGHGCSLFYHEFALSRTHLIVTSHSRGAVYDLLTFRQVCAFPTMVNESPSEFAITRPMVTEDGGLLYVAEDWQDVVDREDGDEEPVNWCWVHDPRLRRRVRIDLPKVGRYMMVVGKVLKRGQSGMEGVGGEEKWFLKEIEVGGDGVRRIGVCVVGEYEKQPADI